MMAKKSKADKKHRQNLSRKNRSQRSQRSAKTMVYDSLEPRQLLATVQIDFSSAFNQDSIRNTLGGTDDTTDSPIDGVSRLVTDSYAQNQDPVNGNGLPDDGFFASNAHHPNVQLGYNNNDNGDNIVFNPSVVTIDVQTGVYEELHVFATATNDLNGAQMSVTLNYSDGTQVLTTTVADWFVEVTDGSAVADATQYNLINGMDRFSGIFQNLNDPAVFGYQFAVDPTRNLESFTLNRESGGSLVVLGATAETPSSVDFIDGQSFTWDIASDGSVGDGSNDAYDGGHDLIGFPNQDAIAFEGTREVVVGPATIGNVEVTRKVYVPDDGGFARFLEIVTNNSGTPQNYTVPIFTDTGSDDGTVNVSTSSGDTTFSPIDNWIVTDDANDGAGDPTLIHVVSGTNGSQPDTAGIFDPINQPDEIEYTYDLTLAPGETQIVMHFGAQNADRATALAKAPLLAALDPSLNPLAGMSADEVDQLVNFDVERHLVVNTNSTTNTIFFEDFEDATIEYTTSVADDLSDIANRDYFGRIDQTSGLPTTITYANMQGSGFYGLQDSNSVNGNNIDGLTLDLSANVTNFTDLEFSLFVAEDTANDGNEDWDIASSVRVTAQVDGGDVFNIFAIESVDGAIGNRAPAVDTNFDGVGDGAAITDTFTQFTFDLASLGIPTGDTLDIQITIEGLDTGDEDIAIDSLHLTGINSDQLSLPDAIEIANAQPGADTITFAPGLGTITLGGTQLLITSDVSIQGPGADQLTLDGGGTSAVFRVDDSNAALRDVEISGLKITGGSGSEGVAIDSNENLTVKNVWVADNHSVDSGVLEHRNGALVISDSTFSGNTGTQGAAIHVLNGTAEIINSTVSGNSATRFGGGIEVVVGTAVIRNSTFTGNRSDSDDSGGEVGGGVDGNSNLITMHNTIVAGNFRGSGTIASDVGTTLVAGSSFNLIGDPNSAFGLTHGGPNGNILGDGAGNAIADSTVIDTTLADNGGPTLTHGLVENSPAIDNGSNTLAQGADGHPLMTDQRGESRFVGTVDIGAFESGVVAVAPTVTAVVRDEGGVLARPDLIITYAVTFDQDVTVSQDDLFIVNETTGHSIDSSGAGLSYDSGSLTATWDLSSLMLDAAFYTFQLSSDISGVLGGLALDGNGDGTAGDNRNEQVYVAIPGDLNLDGDVDISQIVFVNGQVTNNGDASNLLASLPTASGATYYDGDLNGDGDVDISQIVFVNGQVTNQGDASILLANLGRSVAPSANLNSTAATAASVPAASSDDLHEPETVRQNFAEPLGQWEAAWHQTLRERLAVADAPLTLAGANQNDHQATDAYFAESEESIDPTDWADTLYDVEGGPAEFFGLV